MHNIVIEKVHPGAIMPTHEGGSQHENVGLDMYAAEAASWELVAPSIWTVNVTTGLRFELPTGVHLRFAARSGLAFRDNIISFPGTVDSSYRGIVMLKLYAFSEHPPKPVAMGDKIAQGIFFKSLDYQLVEGTVDLNTSRGEKGFGSSG